MTYEEDLDAAAQLRGWFTQREGRTLADLARGVAAHDEIVEIGAFAGRSTAFLAAGSRAGARAHITSIDDWSPAALPDGTDQALADDVLHAYQMTLDWTLVTPLRARSTWLETYWLKPIGLLFLDATHLYDDTIHDINAWKGHLFPGAFAAFHDYHKSNPGVVQATDEAVAAGDFTPVSLTGTLRVLRRT